MSLYLLELIQQDYLLCQHYPSLLALCCLEVSDLHFCQKTRLDPLYTENHSIAAFKECICEIDKLLETALQNCNDVMGLLEEYMDWCVDDAGRKEKVSMLILSDDEEEV